MESWYTNDIIIYKFSTSFLHNISAVTHNQSPDFDDMSSFFPCEIDDAIQYIYLGYVAKAPKMVIL